jgi:transposase
MSHKTAATVAHTIGIDTGKNILHLIGVDDQGAIVLREKIARGRIAARLANVPRCLIGIEAGMATHYVARELSALGHDVKQVPPAYGQERNSSVYGPDTGAQDQSSPDRHFRLATRGRGQ